MEFESLLGNQAMKINVFFGLHLQFAILAFFKREPAWQPGHEDKCVGSTCIPAHLVLQTDCKVLYSHLENLRKNAFEKRHISIYICMKFHLKRVFALLPRKEQIPSNFHLANKLGCLLRNQVFIF